MRPTGLSVFVLCLLAACSDLDIGARRADSLEQERAGVARSWFGATCPRRSFSRGDAAAGFLRARHDETTLRDLVETRAHESGGVVHQT